VAVLLPDMTIGERIKMLRGKTTQAQLAALAGVSKDTIAKLEQGQRKSAELETLHKIARALDVDTAVLVAKGSTEPADVPNAGVVAIRHALTAVDDLVGEVSGEPVTLEYARQTVDYSWGSYWAGRYDTLGALLPTALPQLRATVHASSGADLPMVNDLMARLYWVTGCTLVHMGATDAAFLAVDKAIAAAALADDELLDAALRGSVAWQLLVQGRYEESVRVSTTAAAAVEPHGEVGDEHLSVYGALLLQAAVASGRNRLVPQAQANGYLDSAGEVSQRIGADRDHYETPFGPSQVTMQTVDVHIGAQDYVGALDAAALMPANPGLPLAAKARHHTDKAYAASRLGHDRDALNTLLHMEQSAPDWFRYQAMPRLIVAELLDNHRRRTDSRELLGLAHRLGVQTI